MKINVDRDEAVKSQLQRLNEAASWQASTITLHLHGRFLTFTIDFLCTHPCAFFLLFDNEAGTPIGQTLNFELCHYEVNMTRGGVTLSSFQRFFLHVQDKTFRTSLY